MPTTQPSHRPQRLPHLPIRSRRVIGGHGEEFVGTSVYCPIVEKSVAVAKCEACARFHALHFDAETRTTSVTCACDDVPPGPAEEAALRDAIGGPLDPQTPLADIMTKTVVCVRPDTSLDDVLELLDGHAFGGMPVVDEAGRAVGIVSRADVLRAHRERGDTEETRRISARPKERGRLDLEPGMHVYEPTPLTARDVMSPVVLAVHESCNIGQAAALMAFEGVHRLPIVADVGEVVGILSSLDVLRWLGRRSGYLIPEQTRG